MSRPFLRHVFRHPAHPGPPWFSIPELAAWDVQLLVWAVSAGYWRAGPFEPTEAGAAVLDGFLTYYSSDVHLSAYDEHRIGELLLYIKQIDHLHGSHWTHMVSSTRRVSRTYVQRRRVCVLRPDRADP